MIAKDKDPRLNGLVISSLRNAVEPSLSAVKMGWNNDLKPVSGVFRNSVVHQVTLMDKSTLGNDWKFTFQSAGGDGYPAL